ncbi:MAG TPA: matrixin family metalloprotease [Oculatellaceae cyanobacterium]
MKRSLKTIMIGCLLGASLATGVQARDAQDSRVIESNPGVQAVPADASLKAPPNLYEIAAHQRALVNEALSIPPTELTPARFMRMPVPGEGLETSDYLPIVRERSQGLTMRFTKMPIPVYIDVSGHPDLLEICQSALNMWEGRSNYMVRFACVQNPKQARIIVRFHHRGFNASGSPRGAVTHLDWKFVDGAYRVTPQIIDINLDVAQDRTAEQRIMLLTNLFAHEVGHALGMVGHSTEQSDLLFKETDEYSRLSERDMNTLYKLYQSKVDVPL